MRVTGAFALKEWNAVAWGIRVRSGCRCWLRWSGWVFGSILQCRLQVFHCGRRLLGTYLQEWVSDTLLLPITGAAPSSICSASEFILTSSQLCTCLLRFTYSVAVPVVKTVGCAFFLIHTVVGSRRRLMLSVASWECSFGTVLVWENVFIQS